MLAVTVSASRPLPATPEFCLGVSCVPVCLEDDAVPAYRSAQTRSHRETHRGDGTRGPAKALLRSLRGESSTPLGTEPSCRQQGLRDGP